VGIKPLKEMADGSLKISSRDMKHPQIASKGFMKHYKIELEEGHRYHFPLEKGEKGWLFFSLDNEIKEEDLQ
jgi:hypothetical protein